MQSWHFRGLLHNNTAQTWGAEAAKQNWWCPDAVWDGARQRMVLYFTNQGVSPAQWGVATSSDGIHFDLVSLATKSSQTDTTGGSVDGNALLVDDDGVGYIAYASVGGGGNRSADHMVTIDRLAPDLTSSTLQLAAPIFPDSFVEGVLFFKRRGIYYIVYSSCCCCCTAGAGAVVYRATNISGPWERQARDVNCDADAPICAGMPAPQRERPTGHLIIPAQGFNVCRLRGAGGDGDENATYLWTGERWLSGPYAPSSKCEGDCAAPTGVCARDPRFVKGHEFSYWAPLEFDDSAPPVPPPVRTQPGIAFGAHGSAVSVRGVGTQRAAEAQWANGDRTPGGGCDQVALIVHSSGRGVSHDASALTPRSFWVIVAGDVPWVDVGWCPPALDTSGSMWLGYQGAYAYRGGGGAGNFIGGVHGNSSGTQGRPYGSDYGAGANVTAMVHADGVTLEFLLDGTSQGRVTLNSSVPRDWVGCVGACGRTSFALSQASSGPRLPGAVRQFRQFQDNVTLELA